MTIEVRHAWLQKHASPSARDGEFHWHPADRDRELRTSVVERLRGIEPPAVLWQLSVGQVAWAQLFAATAPHDRRRYVGVALAIADEPGAQPADLLAALVAPAAAPWSEVADEPRPVGMTAPVAASAASDVLVAAIGRGLLTGGSVRVADPYDAQLPRLVASIERLLPTSITTTIRRGAWRATGGGVATINGDRVSELLARAWRDPKSHAAHAWQLLVELADARGASIDAMAAELDRLDDIAERALTEPELALLGDGRRSFLDVLHAWGRGRLDRSSDAATLPARLADVLALRVLARLVAGGDGAPAIREARWHALLPAARRSALLRAIADRARSLRQIVETAHA